METENSKMIQELVSPTKNHVFELNNKIKVLDNKIQVIGNKIDDFAKDVQKSNTELKQSIEYLKSNLSSVLTNGHDYVEIAGIKWATMNVGANKVTDYGLYFQWGDTKGYTADQVGTGDGKKKFAQDWSDYKFTTDGGKSFTKYNGTDNKIVLDLVDDAVHAAWGGYWRMPTSGEIDTVLNSTAVTKTWKSDYNGTSVAGYELHDKTSNDTLFLPACGYADDGSMYYVGSDGYYWLSSLDTDGVSYAYELGFDSDDAGVNGNFGRYSGRCVRGVLDV